MHKSGPPFSNLKQPPKCGHSVSMVTCVGKVGHLTGRYIETIGTLRALL